MDAQLFDVVTRVKQNLLEIAAASDFRLKEKGVVDAQVILDDPNISLYCLDPEGRQAVFVRTPAAEGISAAPFYYIGQYENAEQLLKVPYTTLEQLADQVELDDRRLILIYSMGRCGSTLVSSALKQAEEVESISEPDVFSQLVQMYDFSGANQHEISRLVRSCLLLTCKQRGNGIQPVWAIKFRSFVVELAEMFYAHFPWAKCLFLYRQPVPWARSVARAFGGDAYPTQEQIRNLWISSSTIMRKFARVDPESFADLSAGKGLAFLWLNFMERCLERLAAGQAMLPVRYTELKMASEAIMAQIFAYCDVAARNVDDLVDVLNQDAQASTPISRDKLKQVVWEVDDESLAEMRTVIAAQPVINTEEYMLPGTLTL